MAQKMTRKQVIDYLVKDGEDEGEIEILLTEITMPDGVDFWFYPLTGELIERRM